MASHVLTSVGVELKLYVELFPSRKFRDRSSNNLAYSCPTIHKINSRHDSYDEDDLVIKASNKQLKNLDKELEDFQQFVSTVKDLVWEFIPLIDNLRRLIQGDSRGVDILHNIAHIKNENAMFVTIYVEVIEYKTP